MLELFWVHFCISCYVKIQLHSCFPCGCPISQHHLLKTVLSSLDGFFTLGKNHLTIQERVYCVLPSIPLVFMSVCLPVPHCFEFCGSVVIFENRMWELPRFFFFFFLKIVSVIQDLLRVYLNFKMGSPSKKKNQIFIGVAWIYRSLRTDILTFLSCNWWTWEVSIYLSLRSFKNIFTVQVLRKLFPEVFCFLFAF